MVLLVFLTTPLESVEITSNFSIVKLVSILLILSAIVARKNIFVIRDPLFIILIIYTLITIVSFLWSVDKVVTFQKSMTTMLPNFIVTLIIFYAINDREDLERIFVSYILGCVIVAGVSLYAFRTGYMMIEEYDGRVTALNQDQNELSFLLSFGIIVVIYLLMYSNQKRLSKSLLVFLALLFAFVILTTGSRMGLIILIMIAGTLIVTNMKSARVIFIIPLIFVLGIAFFQYLPDTTSERLLQIQDQIDSKDLTGRVSIWKLGLAAFENKDAWVLGTGFSTFQSLMAEKTGWGPSPHNTYLSTFVELGSLGLLIFLSLISYLVYRVWYLVRNCSAFFILLILPLISTMFVLATSNRRWLFLTGVIIIKLWQFAREEAAASQ